MARERRRISRVGRFTNIAKEPEGWSVVITRDRCTVRKYFGNAVFGGQAQALVAAQHFRDRLLQRIAPDSRVRQRAARRSRSVTGVVGVSLERYTVDGRV
jgi:hypothetical protein